jgi:hypothetical protein
MPFEKFHKVIAEAYGAIGVTPQTTIAPVLSATPAPQPGLGIQPHVVQQQPGAIQQNVPGVQPGAMDLDPNTNKILQGVVAKQGKGLPLTPDESKLIAIYNQKIQQQNQAAQRAHGVLNRAPVV